MYPSIKFKSLVPVLALVVLCLCMTFFNPRFFTLRNGAIIGRQNSVLLIAALGQTFVILAGSIDLSVLGVMSVSSLTLSMLVLNAKTPYNLGLLAIPIALLVGGGFGFCNGLLHTKTKIPSFMVTLGTGYVGSGLAVVIYKGRPVRILDNTVRALALKNIGGFPNIVIIVIAALIIAIFLSKYTRVGRYIYGMGGDESRLKLVGISVEKYKILMFTLAGFFFGAAGVLMAARVGTGTANIDPLFLLHVIAAVVIGGTALTGGTGGVLQTLVGALILTVLSNGMVLMRANPFIQDAIIGAVTIAAVTFTLDRSKIPIIK